MLIFFFYLTFYVEDCFFIGTWFGKICSETRYDSGQLEFGFRSELTQPYSNGSNAFVINRNTEKYCITLFRSPDLPIDRPT